MIQSGNRWGWQDYASILTPLGKGLKLGMELELGISGDIGDYDNVSAIIKAMEQDKTLSEFGLSKAESPGIEYCTRPASLDVHEQTWPSILRTLSKLPVRTGDGIGGHIHAPKHKSVDECNKVGYLFNRHDTRHIVEALTRRPGYGGYEYASSVRPDQARVLSMDLTGYTRPTNSWCDGSYAPANAKPKPLLERGRIIGSRGHGQPVVLGRYDTYEFRCFPASLVFEEIMAFLEMTDMAWHYAPSRDWHELNLMDVIPQVTADGSYPYMKAHFQKKVLDAKLEKVDPRLAADDRQAALSATA